mgnify:CR=1 FL=1
MRKKQKLGSLLSVVLLVALIFISSFIASIIQRSGGRVDVRTIKFPTQNGQLLVADLFKPKMATRETPAPLVIVIPGFQRSKETLSNISIELSRRGIVVITIDPYSQGFSSSSMSKTSASSEGYGMYAIVDYIYNTTNLNYIDKSRIAVTGHSAGGLAAVRGAQYFGKEAISRKTKSKLHSVYISGMLYRGLEEKNLALIRSNTGLSYAFHDEGAFRNINGNGDMRYAPEAIGLVNSGLNLKDKINDSLSIGRYYGALEDRTLRVVHNEKVLHPFQPYSSEATKNQLNFFNKVFLLNTGLSSKNQVWYWKELFTFVSLICSMLMIVPLTSLFLRTKVFRTIKKPMADALPRPSGQAKTVFWVMFILTAFIASVSFIPMSNLSLRLFTDASTRVATWFFPQRMNNAVMLWALLNGTIGLVIFFISNKFFHNSDDRTVIERMISLSKMEIGKTIILSLLVFLSYFGILSLVYYIFHVDYRILFIGVRTFQPDVLIVWLMYIPVFFLFFLSNSLRVNGSIFYKGIGEIRGMLFSGLATTLGLIIILLIQYVCLLLTGKIFWTETNLQWLYVNLLFGVVPMIFILPIFNRYFYRMTGRVYLGPLVTCFIFIMILSSNTVCYIPL